MKAFNLLMVINTNRCIGQPIRYYVQGKRVTESLYNSYTDRATRQDSFMTTFKNDVTRHYKTVYL